MVRTKKHILLIEPYYGGSHKAFLQGLQAHVAVQFTLLTLPARKWKMRMQVAAPWFAEQVSNLMTKKGLCFDAMLCSTFIDVAVLRSLLAAQGIQLPLAIYFHENQFAYPVRVHDPAYHQFANINWTSALVADRVYFNSRFNYNSFLSGIESFLEKTIDVDLRQGLEQIRGKSTVLYPGIECADIDQAQGPQKSCPKPVIVWNHRWEHDKDPETFFSALFRLQQQGIDFKVMVLGQHFRKQPKIFTQARERLSNHILHFGYAQSRKEYAALLRQGDVVVSTARHEFFGIAVLEAVRAGCRPLVPDRLSYCELYPRAYRYDQEVFFESLKDVLKKQSQGVRMENQQLAAGYSWLEVAQLYEQQLTDYF